MDAIDEAILSPLEKVAQKLGLNSPGSRGVAVGALVAGVLYVMKPELMFDATGKMRPWNVMDDSENATAMPIWLVAAGAATAATFLI